MLCLKYQFSGDTRAHESWSVMWRSVWPGYGGLLSWFGWDFFSMHNRGAFFPPHQSSFDVEISLKLISYP